MSKEFWNDRYKSNETVYGHQPNDFFKAQMLKLPPGKLLLPAEGEGRNALYAASLGWAVHAFDYSQEARRKALAHAAAANVAIDYTLGDISETVLPPAMYDAIGLIYVHLPPSLRREFHHKCIDALKPGGTLILEAFDQNQINNLSGGPRDAALLYTVEMLQEDFRELHVTHAKQGTIFLEEGPFHAGMADIVRLVASKPAIRETVKNINPV